jgi:hypothetical protein
MADPNSPLKDLYAGDGSSSIMSYPHDLGSSRKGHFITFSILSPTKSTYGSQSSAGGGASAVMSNPTTMVSNAQTAMNSAATTATSAAAGITSTVKAAAGAANQALSTFNQTAASVASVVGVVAGAKSIISGSLSSGTVGGTLGGLASLSVLADTATSIPGVSSFLTDPMGSSANAWDSIKNFINNPLKSSSSALSSASGFTTNSGNPKFTSPTMKPTGYINLYMPDTVSLSQHASYNDISLTAALGAAGGVAEGWKERGDFGRNLSSLYDGLVAAGKNGDLPAAIKTIKDVDNPLMLEAAGKGLGSAGIVGNGAAVSQYLLKNAGYAINPQMEVIFTQMDFRRFQFDFTFTPKTAAESKTVRDIIKAFRLNAAPDLHGGGGRYFDIPSVFQIEYMHLESKNENLHKFAPCVLETIMVDYAPEVGWVTYEDGMPVKTRLTLQFKENEIMTREKIEHQGY